MLFAPDHVAEATLVELPGRPPAGIALYYRTVNTFRGQIGMFLEDLFVEPDLRGQGIGHALLSHLAQMAIDRGYNMIQWSVLNWNEPSLKFYDRIGAVKVDDWQVRRLAGTAMATLAGGMAKYG
jgi:GNAT superfamily N-acetyltransferase